MTALLEGRQLVREYERRPGRFGQNARLRALDGVDFELAAGETVALVGESGSGKTTLARLLLRILPPTSGAIRFRGEDLLALSERELPPFRRAVQAVFQDALASLDPRQTIGSAVGEPLAVHAIVGVRERSRRVSELLVEVGLPAATSTLYPHQLSGGERQRVALARALATEPEALVADEPMTALDARARARLVELLAARQRERGLALLFIAHDLKWVERIAARVVVLLRGRVVESGAAAEILRHPRHPYTAALLEASRGLAPSFWNFSPEPT